MWDGIRFLSFCQLFRNQLSYQMVANACPDITSWSNDVCTQIYQPRSNFNQTEPRHRIQSIALDELMNYNNKPKSSNFAWIPSILSNRILNLSRWYLFNLIVFFVPTLKQSKSKSWRSTCRGGIGKGERVGQIKIVHHICSPKKREVHCQTYHMMINMMMVYDISDVGVTLLHPCEDVTKHKLISNSEYFNTTQNCWQMTLHELTQPASVATASGTSTCASALAYGMKWNRHHDVLQKN